MKLGVRIIAAVATALVVLATGIHPAQARVYKPDIDRIDGPVAGGSTFSVTVHTLGAGRGAQLLLQTRSGKAWTTVGQQNAGSIVATRKFKVTAPKTSGTFSLRAIITRGRKIASTSAVRSVEVFARGLTPEKPYPARVGGQQGEWFSVEGDQLRFGPTITGQNAWRLVAPETATVGKPAPGWSIVLGSVSYKPYTDSKLNHLFYNVRVTFLGNDGKEYGGYDILSPGGKCGYSLDIDTATGDPALDTTPLSADGYGQFYPCAVVPEKAINGGIWKVNATGLWQPRVQYVQAVTSLENPFPKGVTPFYPYSAQTSSSNGDWLTIPFVYGTYGLLFGSTLMGEAAWQVLKDSPIAEHPAPGWSAMLVTGTLENRTDQKAAPFLEIVGPTFVGNDGVQYMDTILSPGGECPWIPTDLFQRSVDPRESIHFTACTVVPDSVIAGGVWMVGPFNPFVVPQSLYVQAAS